MQLPLSSSSRQFSNGSTNLSSHGFHGSSFGSFGHVAVYERFKESLKNTDIKKGVVK